MASSAAARGRPRRRGGGRRPSAEAGQAALRQLQVARQVARRRVTVVGFLRQAPLDRPREGWWHASIALEDRRRLHLENGGHGLRRRRALERSSAREHLVDERSPARTGPSGNLQLARTARETCSPRSPEACPGPSAAAVSPTRGSRSFGRHQLGQAEVQDLQLAVARHEEVAGLRSRWTIPRSWAAVSPRAAWTAQSRPAHRHGSASAAPPGSGLPAVPSPGRAGRRDGPHRRRSGCAGD